MHSARSLAAAVIAGAVCTACGAATVRKPPSPSAIAGTWSLLDGSTVQMRITGAAAVTVEAWAADDKNRFEVSQVSFDGHHLRATFRYPPTGVTSTSDLELVDSDRLEGTVSGSYVGRETWVRAGP